MVMAPCCTRCVTISRPAISISDRSPLGPIPMERCSKPRSPGRFAGRTSGRSTPAAERSIASRRSASTPSTSTSTSTPIGAKGPGARRSCPDAWLKRRRAAPGSGLSALTPRPFLAQSQLARIEARAAERELRATAPRVDPADVDALHAKVSEEINRRVFFPTRVTVAGASVRFLVPTPFLGGPAQDSWGYIVAVSGSRARGTARPPANIRPSGR